MTTNTPNNRYAESGVNIDAGNEVIQRIAPHVKATHNPLVIPDFGAFSGAFQFPANQYKKPILVSGTDGVGTKIKLAIQSQKHDTIGIDLVAMCANDILTCGAKALFFLDYIATHAVYPDLIETLVKSIAEGCQECGAALLGGETAEMPDMYAANEYDLAGFIVGVVDEKKRITGSSIEPGDVLLGLASSGFHSNGYSLLRKVLFKEQHFSFSMIPPCSEHTLIEMLLAPTRIYEPVLRPLIEEGHILGMAHITGGGLVENIPRMLPKGLTFSLASRTIPEAFTWIQELGNISMEEMYRVFNMGVGMVFAVKEKDCALIQSSVAEPLLEIGSIQSE